MTLFILQVVAGEYKHRVEFDPAPSINIPPDTTSQQDKTMPRGTKKRNIDDYFSNPKKTKTESVNGSDRWEQSTKGDLLVYQKNLTGRNKVSNYTVLKLYETIKM